MEFKVVIKHELTEAQIRDVFSGLVKNECGWAEEMGLISIWFPSDVCEEYLRYKLTKLGEKVVKQVRVKYWMVDGRLELSPSASLDEINDIIDKANRKEDIQIKWIEWGLSQYKAEVGGVRLYVRLKGRKWIGHLAYCGTYVSCSEVYGDTLVEVQKMIVDWYNTNMVGLAKAVI